MLRRTRWSTTERRSGARGSPSSQQPRLQFGDADHAARGSRIPASAAPSACRLDKVLAEHRRQLAQQLLRQLEMLVGGQPEAQPELGVVLEQRIRPGRSAAFPVVRPRRDRQVAAVDGRAAGGVGDLQRGRRTTATAASDTASRRNRRRRRRTRTAAPGTARRAHWRSRPARGHSPAARQRIAMSLRAGSSSGSLSLHRQRLARRDAGQASTHSPQPVQSSTENSSVKLHVREAARIDRRRFEACRCVRQAAPRRSISRGSRRAGRRSCTGRTGCSGQHPTPARYRRCCAFPRSRCPTARCRRPACRLTGISSPRPSSIAAVTSRTKSGALAGTGRRALPRAAGRAPALRPRTAAPACRRPRGSSACTTVSPLRHRSCGWPA